MAGPLTGLKVLDLSRYIAGPYCGMLLGDLGADVVKIEKPGAGEDARKIPPLHAGDSLFVFVFNRNKRSLTIDLRHPDGPGLVRELAQHADILIENFRPGIMEEIGCGWGTLHGLDERLIMARISGYGQDGPYAKRATFDAIAQASSGLMTLTGPADGPPTIAGTTIVDHTTGLHAVIGILAALQARHQTGRGQLVDAALFDSAMSMMMTAIPAFDLFGTESVRDGNRDRFGAPGNAFPTKDGGYVYIIAGGDDRFQRCTAAMERPDLLEDRRFQDNDSRMVNVAALEEAISEWTAARTATEIEAIMAKARIPCGVVKKVADLFDHPQVKHRHQILEVPHASDGSVRMQGHIAHLSENAADIRRPPPAPGQHRAEVLAEWLSYDASRIRALADSGVI